MCKSLLALTFLLISAFEGFAQKRSYKETDSLRDYLNTKKRFKLKPTVDCFTVDTCFIRYSDINLTAIRSSSESASKIYQLNNASFSIATLNNIETELEIDSREFPNYEFSDYYLIGNKLYVISTIPFCTGIACKYRYAQIFDLVDKIVYEKIVSWDK